MKATVGAPLLLGIQFFGASVAYAEQGCPDGLYPGGMQPNGPICIPIPGARTRGQSPMEAPQKEQWSARWGAIATDNETGYMGTADGHVSKSIADETALKRCRKVGQNCTVVISYSNQCAALAVGTTKYAVGAGTTLAEASVEAAGRCATAGAACEVIYSACSLAQRDR